MTTLSVQPTVTKTNDFDGSAVNVGAVIGDWTLTLTVFAMTGSARFIFADSLDSFSTSLTAPTVSIIGDLSLSHPRRYTFQMRDFPDLRLGVMGAVLRLSVENVTGSVTYQAQIEY